MELFCQLFKAVALQSLFPLKGVWYHLRGLFNHNWCGLDNRGFSKIWDLSIMGKKRCLHNELRGRKTAVKRGGYKV